MTRATGTSRGRRPGLAQVAGGGAVAQIDVRGARLLLMDGQGLLADPGVNATAGAVYKVIEQMGFVQLDTISVAERAHHHILLTRFDGYRPAMLERLHHVDRRLFEHMTHDASLIPTVFFPHWRARFERSMTSEWWKQKLGEAHASVIAAVRERIEKQGPVRSRDFEVEVSRKSGGWWDWAPHKTALEYLWRTGVIAVAERDQFQKVYDLTERVYPAVHGLARPSDEEHVEWACRTAMERLGVATAREVAQFWKAISIAEAAAWCRGAVARGELEAVEVAGAGVKVGGGPNKKARAAFAVADWRRRAARAEGKLARLKGRTRVLSPFDPVIRDRQRALAYFGFDYTFEAFVPAAKRRFGYYTLPMLEGDRFTARLDAKLHRERGELEIKGLWWEPGVKVTRARRAGLEECLVGFTKAIGGERVVMGDGEGE